MQVKSSAPHYPSIEACKHHMIKDASAVLCFPCICDQFLQEKKRVASSLRHCVSNCVTILGGGGAMVCLVQ
jgi:hypothetical protein